jgi:uncharacterized Fe-S center protein
VTKPDSDNQDMSDAATTAHVAGLSEAAAPKGDPPGGPATVWFAPVRTSGKESLVARCGKLAEKAGIRDVIAKDDFVAVKLHFGEEGNTGFLSPVYVREVVRLAKEVGGRPFLTDSNTLYTGQRANAVDHIACAIHHGFSFATIEAPIIIADGLDGRDSVEVPVPDSPHFATVRIGAAVMHANALVVMTHVKGHELTGMGGTFKNVGMGLGARSAKQRMHADFKPDIIADNCTRCGRCVESCAYGAMTLEPETAVVDLGKCVGCGECVARCAYGAIGLQWKTDHTVAQQKIVDHAAAVLNAKKN